MEQNLEERRTVNKELVGGDDASISGVPRSAIILYIILKAMQRALLKNLIWKWENKEEVKDDLKILI